MTYDKLLHFIVGLFIFACVYLVTKCSMTSIGMVLCIAGLKEMIDFLAPNNWCDVWDLFATIAGGLFLMGYTFLL